VSDDASLRKKYRQEICTLKTAELQKDLFDMQQKVKRYKEHIYELQSELGEREITIATHKEKIDKLQPQLSQGTEQSSAETGHELANKHQSELDNLASHLCQEKDRAQEFAKECNVLKTSLEKLENANKGSDNETHKLRLG